MSLLNKISLIATTPPRLPPIKVASYAPTALLLANLFVSLQVHSIELEIDDDFTFEWSSVVTYGAQWRVQGPQKDLTTPTTGSNGELDTMEGVMNNAFILNGNDGNNNFDTGLVSNRVSYLTDIGFNWDHGGVFIRAKYWYDDIYSHGTDNRDYDSYNPNPIFGANDGENVNVNEFPSDTRDYMNSGGRLLDAFIYHSYDIGERSLNVRAGRQVISWGEALLTGGGIVTATNHVDAQIRNTPGLEIKEIFLPTGAIYGQFDLTDSISLEAYYQYEWQPNLIDPAGSYFSEFDTIGTSGHTFMMVNGKEQSLFGADTQRDDIKQFLPGSDVGTMRTTSILVPHERRTIKPKDSGQFGIAGRYLFDNGSELGMYFVKYHEKTPNFILPLDKMNFVAPLLEDDINRRLKAEAAAKGEPEPEDYSFKSIDDLTATVPTESLITLLTAFSAAAPDGFDYQWKYFDNVQLYGLSYSTVLGTTNVAGEITYRPNTPLMQGNLNRYPNRSKFVQMNINALHIFGPSQFYDASTLIAEFVTWNAPGKKDYDGSRDKDRLAVQNTATGWGYSFLWNFDYKNVLQGIDIVVPLYVNHGVKGAMFTTGFRNKQVTVGIGATAKFVTTGMEMGLNYATYFGSKKDIFQSMTSDRDNVSFNVKYPF